MTAVEKASVARRAYVGALLFLGILHVIAGDDLRRMLPTMPDGSPGPLAARGVGALVALAALGMLVRPRARHAALALTGLLLAVVLGLHVPRALPTGDFTDPWLNVLKWLAMASGPLVVAAGWPSRDDDSWQDGAVDLGASAAPWLLGAFMLGSAVLHVRFAEFVAELMQPWMPWRIFWTYFAAVALAAGGIGLAVARTRRPAALLTSLMIFSWFVLVHTPRMLAAPGSPIGWSEMAEALAFSAMAYLIARRTERSEDDHGVGRRPLSHPHSSVPGLG